MSDAVPPPPSAYFGVALRALREEAGLTQEQLARSSGVSASAIARYETGRYAPQYDQLFALARGLGISAAAIVARGETALHFALVRSRRT